MMVGQTVVLSLTSQMVPDGVSARRVERGAHEHRPRKWEMSPISTASRGCFAFHLMSQVACYMREI
jgi:hypothetical protein